MSKKTTDSFALDKVVLANIHFSCTFVLFEMYVRHLLTLRATHGAKVFQEIKILNIVVNSF